MFRFGERLIGQGQPVFVCAEIGANHNGSLELALRLIDAAAGAGADAVKFQKRAVHLAIAPHRRNEPKETPWGTMSYLEYRERLELSPEDYSVIAAHCQRIGMPWFASVWDVPSLVFLKERFASPAYKIPSACLTDTELLRATARQGRSLIVSTGMSTIEEVDHAVASVEGNGSDTLLCHCNSTYPCPPDDLNLRVILTLAARFPDVEIGYSGHETGLAPTLAAVALGATYVERHITLDRAMWGTDHAASVEPSGFKRMVKDIRLIERALGDGVKRVTQGEVEVMRRLRRLPVEVT